MMARMRQLAVTLVLGASFAACGSDSGPKGGPDAQVVDPTPDASTGTDECGDIRGVQAVYYGTLEPTYLPMSAGQVLAVGSFGGCSGLLITPTWVLTARHCQIRNNDEFCMGADPTDPNVCIGVLRTENASGDLTLVELEQNAEMLLPEVIPVPILTEDMDQSWIGRTLEAAGYGQMEDGNSGTRKFTAEPLVELTTDTLTIDGEGTHGVCFGDSGGPAMAIAGDGTVRVVGALSYGDSSCVDRDTFTRVDTFRQWIEGFTGPTVVEGAECGSVTAEGRCVGGMAVWCENDVLTSDPCETGTCGWDGSAYRCITGADPCGGVDTFGTCDNDVARWCENGQPRTRDCGSCGQVCRTQVAMGGAVCVPDPCMGTDYLGRCNGDVAEWCDGGVFQTRDCAAEGTTCAYINDEIGYYCVQ